MLTLTELIKAYDSCRKHKRISINALNYEISWERELYTLNSQLAKKTYKPSRSICFAVSYPKVREIFAADFRDRVIHHLLINRIEQYFEKRFIFDSCACRPNKGSLFAVRRLKHFEQIITENNTKQAYFLQLDIKNFFYNINKQILMNILTDKLYKSKITDNEFQENLWLAQVIIFHNPCDNYKLKGDISLLESLPNHKSLFNIPKGKGLPIGNLTSQFFANVYLNELDQFIKRELKFKYYIRYADDLIILDKDYQKLEKTIHVINDFLKEYLDLELHPNKTKLNSIYSGIDFLGYIVKPKYTLTRKRITQNLKKKLYYFNTGFLLLETNCKEEAVAIHNPPTQEELESICRSMNSLLGHISWSNSYNFRQDVYHNHLGILDQYLEPQKNLTSYKVVKNENSKIFV